MNINFERNRKIIIKILKIKEKKEYKGKEYIKETKNQDDKDTIKIIQNKNTEKNKIIFQLNKNLQKKQIFSKMWSIFLNLIIFLINLSFFHVNC